MPYIDTIPLSKMITEIVLLATIPDKKFDWESFLDEAEKYCDQVRTVVVPKLGVPPVNGLVAGIMYVRTKRLHNRPIDLNNVLRDLRLCRDYYNSINARYVGQFHEFMATQTAPLTQKR